MRTIDGRVSTPFILDGAITLAKLPDGVLTANAAGRAKMADNFLTTPKILDDAVTTPKILDLAVTTGKILDLAVTTGKVANGAFNELLGQRDTARVGLSYVGFCFVEPTPTWMSLFQILGKMGNLEAKADEAYTNASLVA